MKTFIELMNESTTMGEATSKFKSQHFEPYRSVYTLEYLEKVWNCAGHTNSWDSDARVFHDLMKLIIVSASYTKPEF